MNEFFSLLKLNEYRPHLVCLTAVNLIVETASRLPSDTLTLDSVVEVPLSLHGLLGHDLKQVVGVGDDLCADY